MATVRTSSYPCRLTPSVPELHVWRETAATGWYVCHGCGVVGICTMCFAEAGVAPLPKSAQRMTCTRHGGRVAALG